MENPKIKKRKISKHSILSGVILTSVVILSFVILIQPWSLVSDNPTMEVGDVAQQDLYAPKKIEYISEVRTKEAQDVAERSIAPVYAESDPAVGRLQLEKMRTSLASISAIRENAFYTPEKKLVDLLAIKDLELNEESGVALLALSDERWDLVRREASNVLELVMRNQIRTEGLEALRLGLPSRVSLALSETEVSLVVRLLSPLVAVNSFYSPELTEAARLLARNSVEPVLVSYRQGEMVVSSGQVITPEIYEALVIQDLMLPVDNQFEFIGAGAIVILGMVLGLLFLIRVRPEFTHDMRSLITIAILFLVFFAAARLSIPNRTIVPYLFPIPAFGILISAMFGMQSGIVFSLILSVLTAYGLPNALDLMPFYFLCSMGAILALGSARRVSQFLWASIMIAGVGFSVVVAFRFPSIDTDLVGMATLAGAALFNGIASSSLALLMQFLLAQFLGSTTALQLLEISRPDFPLLKYFLLKAPGTYQHSLQVVNLAEQAAEKIGADALLTRVGALYHDIGKSENPSFFIENQLPGTINSHDDMDPVISSATIIAHVTDGLALARKYKLPQRLLDFIAEHHGTLITSYQYNSAVKLAGGDDTAVDMEKFRYPGPSPRSRETALLMFADGVEAIVRAKKPKTEEELREIVRKVVEKAQNEGQLKDAPLTQRDLNLVVESFATTMQGVYHPRLDYPKDGSRKVFNSPDAGIESIEPKIFDQAEKKAE
ncbi:MAG: HDIG domain-containing metalloprotein [Chloroflexota bacterium]